MQNSTTPSSGVGKPERSSKLRIKWQEQERYTFKHQLFLNLNSYWSLQIFDIQPYLHESRHHHALRRARGSGGRFLNTKKSNPTTQEPGTRHSEGSSWGTSTTSASDTSCIFSNDDVFQQPDFRASSASLNFPNKAHFGTQSHIMEHNDMLLLSIDRRAEIRSTTWSFPLLRLSTGSSSLAILHCFLQCLTLIRNHPYFLLFLVISMHWACKWTHLHVRFWIMICLF